MLDHAFNRIFMDLLTVFSSLFRINKSNRTAGLAWIKYVKTLYRKIRKSRLRSVHVCDQTVNTCNGNSRACAQHTAPHGTCECMRALELYSLYTDSLYIFDARRATTSEHIHVMLYLMISGRRSITFGCGCLSTLNGDKTTVTANISSVDNSIGCVEVFSSGVCRAMNIMHQQQSTKQTWMYWHFEFSVCHGMWKW